VYGNRVLTNVQLFEATFTRTKKKKKDIKATRNADLIFEVKTVTAESM
jgi:hypothetical protein